MAAHVEIKEEFPVKKSATVGVQFKPDGLNLGAELTTVPYSMIEIDIDFDEFEEKTAAQSDLSYLDRVLGHPY